MYAVLPDKVMAVWSGLSVSAKAILPVIAMRMGRRKESWPSVKVIKRDSGLKRSETIAKAVAELQGKGVIEIVWRRGRRRVFRWPRPESPSAPKNGNEDTPATDIQNSGFAGNESPVAAVAKVRAGRASHKKNSNRNNKEEETSARAFMADGADARRARGSAPSAFGDIMLDGMPPELRDHILARRAREGRSKNGSSASSRK